MNMDWRTTVVETTGLYCPWLPNTRPTDPIRTVTFSHAPDWQMRQLKAAQARGDLSCGS